MSTDTDSTTSYLDRKKHPLSLINAADQNFIDAWCILVKLSPKGEINSQDGVVTTNCNMRIPTFNRIFLEPDKKISLDALNQATNYFKDKQLPFEVCIKYDNSNNDGWSSAGLTVDEVKQYLSQHQLKQQPSRPGMVLTNLGSDQGQLDDVVHVKNLTMLDDFRKVGADAYDIPLHIADRLLPPALLEQPNITLFIRYQGNTPVAISMLVQTDDVAGIYWVGVHSRFRRQGYGRTVTLRAIADAEEANCRFASLQASEMGEPVYRQLGFDSPIQYRFWLWEPKT